jgi:hypothetical protein
MNAETGAVVAVVQYSNAKASDAGGGAIPIGRAADFFDPVRRALDPDQPPVATRRWRDALGREGWEGLGKTWERRGWVDLVVDGNESCWRVKVDADDFDELSVRASNLPDSVAEALFKWSQRRGIRDQGEVKLLGKLLAGAVLPDTVRQRIWDNRLADELLLRLRVNRESVLFDVPWEFMTIEANGGERYLAAEERFGFVRVVPHPDPGMVSSTPSGGTVRAVGIVVHPKSWQKFMPRLEAKPWPKAGSVAAELEADVGASPRFQLEPVERPTPFEVQEALRAEKGPTEIVHYIGFGQIKDGTAALAFSDDADDVAWRGADELFEWVAGSGARVLLVQLVLPRWDSPFEPVRPTTFVDAVANRVNAVVFTRFPVHPTQCHTFNSAFYGALAAGGSVETAVQQARTMVQKNQYLGDAAGFGSFTLITGPKSDTRLVPPAVSDPLISGTKQEPRDTARPAVRGREGDSFQFSR